MPPPEAFTALATVAASIVAATATITAAWLARDRVRLQRELAAAPPPAASALPAIPAPRASAPSLPDAQDRPRILVVDDEPSVRNFARKAFAACGHDVEIHTADSVTEARALLRRHPYDAMLIDLRLRDGSGADLVLFSRPAAILFSGDLDDAEAARERVSADLALDKGAGLDAIVDAVMSRIEARMRKV